MLLGVFSLKRKRGLIILSIIVVLLGLLVGGFFLYVNNYYKADSDAVEALKSNDDVTVINNEEYISFIPKDNYNNAIIFYQGAKVEAEAYAPLLKLLAENDIACYAIKTTFRLSFFDVGDYSDIYHKEKHDNINYYVMGHSLGGVISSIAAKKYSNICRGIILLASYLNSDISDTALKVLSIYGSNDQILNMDSYENSKEYAPDNFIERRIDGGIHSYFGSYGIQNGDGKPYIEKAFQIEKTKDYIIEFINN